MRRTCSETLSTLAIPAKSELTNDGNGKRKRILPAAMFPLEPELVQLDGAWQQPSPRSILPPNVLDPQRIEIPEAPFLRPSFHSIMF